MRFSGSVLFTDIFIGLHVFQSLSFVHIVRYFGTDSLYMHIHLGFSVSILENTARYSGPNHITFRGTDRYLVFDALWDIPIHNICTCIYWSISDANIRNNFLKLFWNKRGFISLVNNV